MAIFGTPQADEMTLIERDAANRAAAYENLKRQGDLPALGLIFGLNLMKNSQTQGLGQAVGGAGMDALANHRAIMDARKKGIDADLNRQTELMRAQEDLNRRDRAFDFDLQKWDYQKEQDAIRNAMERTRIAQAGANAAWQRQMAQKAMEDAAAQKEWNETHFLDEKGVPRVYNPETGKWDEDTTAYRKDAEGNILGIDPLYGVPKQPDLSKFTDVNALGKRYVTESENYTNSGQFLEKLYVGAQQNSAAGDLAMIFSYMKMLDPTSVVREGEQASAQNAAGVPERIRNAYNNLLTGQRLTPSQRKEFLKVGYDLYMKERPKQEARNEYYNGLSAAYGYNPSWVIQKDPYMSLGDEVKAFIGNADAWNESDEGNSGRKIPGVPQRQAGVPKVPSQPEIPQAQYPTAPAPQAPMSAPQPTAPSQPPRRVRVVTNGNGVSFVPATGQTQARKTPKGKR